MKTKQKLNDFRTKLTRYQTRIEPELQKLAKDSASNTYEQFGQYPTEAVTAYNEVLLRGGKRIRGALAICAYELFSKNQNDELINKAAAGLEMLNTYILLADDIQDRSDVRRGGPTAHAMLRTYHQKNHLKDDAQHFGESITINALLIGLHSALNVFTDLPTTPTRKLQLLNHINSSFITTAHGQTLDIFNEVVASVGPDDIDNVLVWKTASYTFINPLQLGGILAGASNINLDVLADYGQHAGRLFQITDDILGIFSEESESGKNPLDDIKEGKRTMLTTKALELASKPDAYFLEQMLGNQKLTMSEFKKCQTIIEASGALSFTRKRASEEADLAKQVLETKTQKWPNDGRVFLVEIIDYLINRRA